MVNPFGWFWRERTVGLCDAWREAEGVKVMRPGANTRGGWKVSLATASRYPDCVNPPQIFAM